jgi:hypothetical protein
VGALFGGCLLFLMLANIPLRWGRGWDSSSKDGPTAASRPFLFNKTTKQMLRSSPTGCSGAKTTKQGGYFCFVVLWLCCFVDKMFLCTIPISN